MDKLPKGWKIQTVNDVFDKILTGTTPPMKEQRFYHNPSIAWYSPSDFNDNIKNLSNPTRKLDKTAIDEGKAKLFNENSLLLVAIGATIGKIGMIKERSCSNQKITAIEFKKNVFPDYGYYWFKYIKPEIIKNSSAATLPIINQNGIKQLPFLLPPLPEQTRIVSKLDALFARIDKSIALLGENIEHTKALMGSVLEKVFGNDISSRLGDIISLKRGYDLPTQFRTKGKFPLLGANGIIDYHNDFKVKGPGVCTGRSGSIGLVHFVEKDYWPLNTSLYVEDFKNNNPKYIYYLLTSVSAELIQQAAFAAVPTLDRKKAHEFIYVKFHKNPKEQKEIVEYLDFVSLTETKLRTTQQSKLTHLKALKSSLLDRAFKGEL
jgi:type I restriction enzyme, S subunit